MRISSRISAGASRSLTRIPLPQNSLKECLNAEGKLDINKARAAFIGGESEPGYLPFMGESSDDLNVYFAVLTFMDLFHDAFRDVVENTNADCEDHAVSREDARCVAKMDEGKYCIVRMDVRRRAANVGVRVTVANPHEIVGKAWAEAKMYAVTCLQMWLRIARQVPWISVDADAELLADARDANRRAELRRENEGRFFCPHFCKGFCTVDKDGNPPDFKCKFHTCGKCVEVTE